MTVVKVFHITRGWLVDDGGRQELYSAEADAMQHALEAARTKAPSELEVYEGYGNLRSRRVVRRSDAGPADSV